MATRDRYDRIAPVYDLMEGMVERGVFARWRRKLWHRLSSGRVLEVGVGTGKNIVYYPKSAEVMAVDLSPGMLKNASRRVRASNADVGLAQMTAEALAFPDNTFDHVVCTFVFCSVPGPVEGLRELGRVCKPEGTILLMEHVRIDRPIIGPVMDIANPLAVHVTGANINRRTEENVSRAGLSLVKVENLIPLGLVKLITAQPTSK